MGSVTVFCGSARGDDPVFMKNAFKVGELLAERGLRVVYGGSKDGCMGAVANGALSKNGYVLGVLPDQLIPWEIAHPGISEMRVVANMAVRKKLLIDEGDLILVLPGGFGTLDEFFEVITLSALGQLSKPTLVFNLADFYSDLLNWMEKVSLSGFAKSSGSFFSIVSSFEELERFLNP